MPRQTLSNDHRMAIVALHKEGLGRPEIIARLNRQYGINISRGTVTYALKRYNETGTSRTRPGQGRKKAVSIRAARRLKRIALANRRDSLRSLAGASGQLLDHPVGRMTVKRILKTAGLHRRVAARKPLLKTPQRLRRLAWCRDRSLWQTAQWARIIFSDEKIFRVASNKRVEFVTRSAQERYAPQCLSNTLKSGPQIHVWGAMGWRGLAPLKRINGNLNAIKYQNEILQGFEQIGPGIAGGRPPWVFMQDRAPAHAAASTQAFLGARNIEVLDWPGNSPDLNPIENLWAEVQTRLPKTLPRNADELWARVEAAWAGIPNNIIRKLYRSLPERVNTVIKNKGGHSRF